jgi:hypothetical protein
MSRGPGKWERAILEAVARVPVFYLTDLLSRSHTRAQTVALNRAMRKLADTGRIAVKYWRGRAECYWPLHPNGTVAGDVRPIPGASHGFVMVYRVGDPEPQKKDVVRLRIVRVPSDAGDTDAFLKVRPWADGAAADG